MIFSVNFTITVFKALSPGHCFFWLRILSTPNLPLKGSISMDYHPQIWRIDIQHTVVPDFFKGDTFKESIILGIHSYNFGRGTKPNSIVGSEIGESPSVRLMEKCCEHPIICVLATSGGTGFLNHQQSTYFLPLEPKKTHKKCRVVSPKHLDYNLKTWRLWVLMVWEVSPPTNPLWSPMFLPPHLCSSRRGVLSQGWNGRRLSQVLRDWWEILTVLMFSSLKHPWKSLPPSKTMVPFGWG